MAGGELELGAAADAEGEAAGGVRRAADAHVDEADLPHSRCVTLCAWLCVRMCVCARACACVRACVRAEIQWLQAGRGSTGLDRAGGAGGPRGHSPIPGSDAAISHAHAYMYDGCCMHTHIPYCMYMRVCA